MTASAWPLVGAVRCPRPTCGRDVRGLVHDCWRSGQPVSLREFADICRRLAEHRAQEREAV